MSKINLEMRAAFVQDDFESMKRLIGSGAVLVDVTDDRRNCLVTALMRSSMRNDKAMVSWLIANGANVKLADSKGWTALHYACEYKNTAIIKDLICAGANVNAQDNLGSTPIDRALGQLDERNINIARVLIEGGADPSIRNNAGISPLDFASDEIRIAKLPD